MSEVTTVDLLRHGEPVGGRKFRGAVNDPLSELGWSQMRAAAGDRCPWRAVISSPLSRCADFARELAHRYDLPLALEPGLMELSFGTWDGIAVAEIETRHAEALGHFWRDPVHYPAPGGEALADFQSRISETWIALLHRYAGQHVLAVTHGGVIRMILCQVLDIPLVRFWRLHVPYAGLSRVKVPAHPAEPQILFHGCRAIPPS